MDFIESYSTELLRRQAARALSLRQLHALLWQELGASAGTYHQLHQRLKKTAAPLKLLERSPAFPAELDWPEDARVQYQRALMEAGYDASPIVALTTSVADAPNLLDDLRATLLELAEQMQDERFSADIIMALGGLPELQQRAARAVQPTTLPRDPPGEV